MLKVKASIRIYTKGLSLSEVSSRLGTLEDFGYSEGDVIGKNPSSVYSETMWGKNSSCSMEHEIDTHLNELLDWLDTKKHEFHELTSKTNIKSDLFLFLASENGQGGGGISSKIINRISSFDLDIVFDIYMDEE